jgi:MFS family permease
VTPSTAPAGVATAGRGPLALLRDRTFGPFFAGKVLSSCGIWVQNIAAAVLMFELTRSAVMVGAVSVMQFAAPFLLALWAGALSDRSDRRVILMIGRVLSGSAVGALAVLVALRGVDGFGGPAPLLVGVGVMGVGLALSSPAMQALVPALVRDEDLEQALGLNAAAPSIARTVGPAAGAALLLLGGPALAFAVAALAHWSFVLVLLVHVRPRPTHRPLGRPSLLGGVRYLVTDRTAGLLMLGVAALGLGADPIVTLTPSLADRLGGGGELVGVMATAFGVGAVVLTALIRQLRRRFGLRMLGMLGFWILAAGLGVAALAAAVGGARPLAPAIISAGFFVSGAGFMMATVALNTRIQRRVPDELRGRVMALWGLAFLGSRPFAALVNGSLADFASVEAALLTAGLLIALASLLARSRYEHPLPAA